MTELACPACGTPVVPAARFCFACGAALHGVAEDHGERRVVTVLFGDLSDFTAWAEDLDPERVKEVTDRVLAALAQAVQLYGGHVDKLTGDGIMAVFGAPTAHEDDAERAVRAATAMQRAVADLVAAEAGGGRRLGLRVGLNTGEVLAGRQAALAYTVVGDTVNTASRLSDAAGVGMVLAGRETALATLTAASWRALPPLRLKGKREPVPAYELVALRPRSAARLGIGDEAPLTGREAELGALVGRLLDAVDRRAPEVVVLAGEAGIGKTRLASELGRFAGELPNGRVLSGRCAPYGEARDLAPLVDVVRTACGIAEGDPEPVARERVRRTAPPVADRLLGLLGLAEPVGGPRAAATPGDPRAEDEVVAALAGLLESLAAAGPVLVAVEDLHWADPALLGVLAGLAHRLAGPVLLLLTAREVPESWYAGLPRPARVALAPLDPGAAERLLRAYLGGSDLAEPARSALLDRAQGNPFFLAELLHLLVDRGLLHHEAAGWVLDGEVPADMLPAGVQAVLAARIDSLDPGAKATLRDAAVVGQAFWPATLARLAGVGDDVVAERLVQLVDREIAVPPAGGGPWTFAHALTREAAYAGIPKVERARRHAATARWAAAEMPGAPAEVDAFVAAHAERAVRLAAEMGLPDDDPARAAAPLGFAALARLGDASLTRDDNVLAVEQFARALALGDDLVVRVSYAQALAGVHRLDAALSLLGEALDAAAAEVRAAALVVLGDVRRKQGDDDAAVGAFVQAIAAAGEAGSDRLAGEAIRSLGLIDFFGGRLFAAEERFRQALELAERVGDRRGTGWALQHLAWSATSRGDYDLATAMLSRAAGVFASFDDIGGLGWCVGTEAYVRLLQGRLSAARELCREVMPSARDGDDHWGVAALLSIDALAASELGDVSGAIEGARDAYALFGAIGDQWGASLAIVARGNALRATGASDEAAEMLAEAAELALRANHPTVRVMALVLHAWCEYDRRDLDRAEQVAYRAVELQDALGLAEHARTGVRVLLGLVRRARGDLAGALALLGSVAESPGSPSFYFPMRQAIAHWAGTLLEAGRADEALRAAERALEVPAEDVRSRVVALRAYGNTLAAAGRAAEAETALRQALDLATGTEHRLEVAASRAALERLVAV